MLTNGIVRGEVNRRWRPPAAPMPLIRPDRARPIDRIIDYFGGAEQRRAPVPPLRDPGRRSRAGEQVRSTGDILRRQHAGQAPVNYISVASVDQHIKKATRLGAEEVLAKTPVPGMGWFAWLKDTEGNVVGIWESDEKAS